MQSTNGQTAPESTLFLTALAAGYRPQSLGKRLSWGTVFSHLITWFLLHSYSTGNLASLATDGRWVVYGLMGGPEVNSSCWHFCWLLAVVVCCWPLLFVLLIGWPRAQCRKSCKQEHNMVVNQISSSTVTVSSPVTPLLCYVVFNPFS